MSLLADIESLAAKLSPSDLPHSENVQQIVGAIVKVLEHEGLTVAEDILPKATVEAVAPEVAAAGAVAPEVAGLLSDLVSRVESLAAKVEGHPVSPSPVSPPPAQEPAGPSTAAPGGPAEPPVEGAQ